MSNKLPLLIERHIADSPISNVLKLTLARKQGDVYVYVTSDRLPLPLSRLISEQPPANALPLGLSRKLGTTTGGYVPPVTPPVNDDVSVTITAVADITPTASVTLTAEVV